jgi:murein DD-endopeptidase MepM/ murein hydrolase activator NlpD
MAADETPPSVPTLRPLSSLGIPLLREEIERARRRRLLIGVGAVIAFLASIAAVFAAGWLAHGESPETHTPPSVVPTQVGYTPPPDAYVAPPDAFVPSPAIATQTSGEGTRTVHHFGQSNGFRSALVAATLTGQEADALIAALTGVMDFRRCRPDHELTIERAPDGVLRRFEYKASITQIYEVTRNDAGALVGHQVEVPIERITLARGGVVQTSLGDALEAVQLGRTMVGTFVEVFDGRISFNTETRAGDTFRIVVDEERIGDQFLRYGTVHVLEYRSQRRGLLQAFYFAPREDLTDFYDETGRAVHGGWLRTPLHFDHISSPFDPHRMHPVLHRVQPHNGIDFAAATGTPVWAAAEGDITFIGERGANGNLISMSHEGGYESHYAHLSRFAPGLSRGTHVRQRQLIGYVGSTGRSTGPHLHFGLKRHGNFVDPARELNGPGRMLPGAQLGRYRAEVTRLRGVLADIELPEAAAPAAARPTAPEPTPAAPSQDVMD